MNVKWIKRRIQIRWSHVALSLFLAAVASASAADESQEPPFREELFLSELQKDEGYAQAVRVGGVVLISATTGNGETFEDQLKTIYVRLQSTLGHFGLTMQDVVQERIYTTDMEALQRALPARAFYYRGDALPAVSWIEVQRLPEPDRFLAVEMMAVVGPDKE